MVDRAALVVRCVDQQPQHHRRTAQMRDAMIGDRLEDRLGARHSGSSTAVPPTSARVQAWPQPLQWNIGTV